MGCTGMPSILVPATMLLRYLHRPRTAGGKCVPDDIRFQTSNRLFLR